MHLDIQLALSGLGTAGAVALLALGLVVTFKGSGVLNFAHGAQATAAVYTYIWLGHHGMSTALAIIGGIGMSIAIGAAMQWFVMKRLAQAPPLAKIVATLGLMLLIQSTVQSLTGDATPEPSALIPQRPVELPFGSPHFVIGLDRLWIVIIATVATALLWVVFRWTRFGLLTQSLADNEQAVTLTGTSPQLVAFTNWAVGSALAGGAGILLAALVPISPTYFTLLLVTAIAAALLGGFTSFWLTFAAALVIGVAQPLIDAHSTSWQAKTDLVGWSQALPVLVIILVVMVRGHAIPLRDAAVQMRMPRAPAMRRPALVLGSGALGCVAWFVFLPRSWADPLSVSLLGALLCVSLVVVLGYTGQVSLVQLAIAGFGALVTSVFAADHGIGFPWAGLLGALAAIPVGLVMAVPALRVRGVELAVVTLAGGLALQSMVFNSPKLSGTTSGRVIPSPTIGSWNLDSLTHPRSFGIAVVVAVGLCLYAVARLRLSHLGQRLLAIRVNERGAAASGIWVARDKVLAFAFSSFLAGLAGAFLAYRSSQVSYESYDILQSVFFLGLAYLGGIGSIPGAVLAGLLFTPNGVMSHLASSIWNNQWEQALAGLALLQIVTAHPDGLAGLPNQLRQARARKRRARAGAETPATSAGSSDGAPSDSGVATAPQERPVPASGAMEPAAKQPQSQAHAVSVTDG